MRDEPDKASTDRLARRGRYYVHRKVEPVDDVLNGSLDPSVHFDVPLILGTLRRGYRGDQRVGLG
ncbi:MAG: hypothetical protein QOF16_820, partial [Actinomycetota bacterium]|nr:hypothetical protein [Actinomycetota bacterium]